MRDTPHGTTGKGREDPMHILARPARLKAFLNLFYNQLLEQGFNSP